MKKIVEELKRWNWFLIIYLIALLSLAFYLSKAQEKPKSKTHTSINWVGGDSQRVKFTWTDRFFRGVNINEHDYIWVSTPTGDALTHDENCANRFHITQRKTR